MQDRLFRIEEVAAMRGESYASTRAAIVRGEIETVRTGKRGVRIPEAEVQRLIGKGRPGEIEQALRTIAERSRP